MSPKVSPSPPSLVPRATGTRASTPAPTTPPAAPRPPVAAPDEFVSASQTPQKAGVLSRLVSYLVKDLARPFATGRDGFVALDEAGRVTGGLAAGGLLRDMDVPPSRFDAIVRLMAGAEPGPIRFTLPDGRVIAGETDDHGVLQLPFGEIARAAEASGRDVKRGVLVPIGVSTPGGASDTAKLLALPKDYDGPLFVCDIDDTLRQASLLDVINGHRQPPIPGAEKLLGEVARRGVPIAYLSAGSDRIHRVNEAFLKQLPAGILLDRPEMALADLSPLNSTQARRQGEYKAAVLARLKTTFPNATLFGLGDDKYGDALAYTRQGVEAFIRGVSESGGNLPADFAGSLTRSYSPEFVHAIANDLDRAIERSASFGNDPGKKDWLGALSRQLDETTRSKAVGGNQLELLVDGDQAFPAILSAIDGARASLLYETYNFLPGDRAAETVADGLIAAHRRGVKVRLVVDAFGSREIVLTKNPTLERLRAAGVDVAVYNPIDSPTDLIPNRNHRKALLVDGRTAFIGGMNTGIRYFGPPTVDGYQHDAFLKVEGPAARDIGRTIADSWTASGSPPIPASELAPQPSTGARRAAKEPSPKVRIVEHVPGQDLNIRAAYLALIDHAERTIDLQNSYPLAEDIAGALIAAAQRGVKIRYIVGSGEGVLGMVTRRRFQKLLDAGVEIYAYPTPVHMKALSVDGKVCAIGSSNLDNVSLSLNREVIAIVEDAGFTRSFDAKLFDRDVEGDGLGRKTEKLPSRLDDPWWSRARDAVVETLWPDFLE